MKRLWNRAVIRAAFYLLGLTTSEYRRVVDDVMLVGIPGAERIRNP